jgi:hypothetical protein
VAARARWEQAAMQLLHREKRDELDAVSLPPPRLGTEHRIVLHQRERIKSLLSEQRCPLWVISRHVRRKKSCRLYPQ